MLRKLFFNLAYLRRPIWDSGVSPPELLSFIATHPPGRALDLGCGTGTNLVTLAKHGWTVTGVDFTPRAIHLASQKLLQNKLQSRLLVADVTRLQGLQEEFDLVLDMGCYHSLAPGKRQAYILNVKRLLAKEGVFLLYVFLNHNAGRTGPGATEQELRFIDEQLRIVYRQDGTERGIRSSTWLTITRRAGAPS